MINKIIVFLFLCSTLFLFGEDPVFETVQIPMRDGKLLAADIYLPYEGANNLPCILVRSPAGRRQATALTYVPMAKFGYAVAIQETRSATDAEGKTIPYMSDGWSVHQDGYDTVEWLAKHPLTNGKIGTLGFSAQGITQLLMAPTAPPSLKCQYIGVAAANLRDHAIFPNGKLLKHQVHDWLRYYAGDAGVWNFAINNQFYDEFWDGFDSIKMADKVNVPALFQGGWYDIFIQGTLDAFTTRQEKGAPGAKGQQKLVVGPWTHFWPAVTTLGEFAMPSNAFQPPIDHSPVRWFDYYLKGIPNDAASMPPVTYYVMGPFDGSPSSGNVWKTADHWPVPATMTPFYLSPDNKLTATATSQNSVASFTHDPANPVPTIGGHNLFLPSGPMDQKSIEERSDVITFTTDPLNNDLEVTGRIKAYLWVASDCEDTDFIVRLTDVYPDGRSILICDGAYRTGLLSLNDNQRNPQSPHEIEIDLWSTSLVFAKGHRIRISISGSNYPRYDLNHNIGFIGCYAAANKIAHNQVLMGGRYASKVVLPVVRLGEGLEQGAPPPAPPQKEQSPF